MGARIVILILLAGLAIACEISPVAPTIVPAATVPAAATVQPNVWDRREELLPWVTSGISTGTVSVTGDGADAVIRVEVAQGDANLHGPDLERTSSEVRSAQLRYRWQNREVNDSLFVTVYLRPIAFDLSLSVPRLTTATSSAALAEQHSGNWIERTFSLTSGSPISPPFSVKYALVNLRGSGTYGPAPVHGVVEIDWIALVR